MNRPRALQTVMALARKEPMTQRELTIASGYVSENAKLLRDDLEKWGIVTTEELVVRGGIKYYEIRLTPLGREIAELAVKMDEVAKHARAAARKDR